MTPLVYFIYLNFTSIEFAAYTRRRACSCNVLPQMPCNAVDAVKSTLARFRLYIPGYTQLISANGFDDHINLLAHLAYSDLRGLLLVLFNNAGKRF